MHTVSGSISLPSPGFFSPFPHGTGSLSVSREYLALEDGPPIFNQDFSCPDLLFVTTTSSSFKYGAITLCGWLFQTILLNHDAFDNWALSLSLATTQEISVDFFSYGYLDVSVLRVRFLNLCIQLRMAHVLFILVRTNKAWAGFPHSDIAGSMLVANSPTLFAGYHVFLRLLLPRHPPCALICLII